MIQNNKYIEEINTTSNIDLPWDKLEGKSLLLSGSTGLIGSYLIDVLMHKNINCNLNCHIYALGRNKDKAQDKLGVYFDNSLFTFVEHDINNELLLDNNSIDYVLHLASNTHPMLYSTKPIETIETNIIGTKNMLDFAVKHNTKRFVFASSVEIYGENRGDVEKFDEEYCGYINCNIARAGYPESKRCGEALCQSYKSEKRLDIVIPRFSRTYGPTMNLNDSKAISQFIMKAVNNEDIVLKSEGNQLYSYCYVADAVTGLLTIMLKGVNGEAYNVSDSYSDITLKDLANICAEYNNKQVIFELPSETEKAGYSKATKALLDNTKLINLGWNSLNNIHTGINKTIDIIRNK